MLEIVVVLCLLRMLSPLKIQLLPTMLLQVFLISFSCFFFIFFYFLLFSFIFFYFLLFSFIFFYFLLFSFIFFYFLLFSFIFFYFLLFSFIFFYFLLFSFIFFYFLLFSLLLLPSLSPLFNFLKLKKIENKGLGGAIYAESQLANNVKFSKFIGNTAQRGGAVYVLGHGTSIFSSFVQVCIFILYFC